MRDLQYMIDVMTAARDGKKIQVNVGEGWQDTDDPAWNWGYSSSIDYRVAPEPRKPREWWIREGDVIDEGARSANGKVFVVPMPDTIHVREILSEDK